MIRVLIVDDQDMIRESLQIVLAANEDIDVIDTAGDVPAAMKCIKENEPDVVLMDIRMPGVDGVEGTRLIKEDYPDIKVIVLTTFDDDEYVFGALKNGASGYLLKGSSVSELADAIRVVHSGGAMINPDIASKLITQFSAMASGAKQNYMKVNNACVDEFSESEINVIKLVGRGLSNKEIAGELYLSEGTVRNYISNILLKSELRDRTQLAIWAVQEGMID